MSALDHLNNIRGWLEHDHTLPHYAEVATDAIERELNRIASLRRRLEMAQALAEAAARVVAFDPRPFDGADLGRHSDRRLATWSLDTALAAYTKASET